MEQYSDAVTGAQIRDLTPEVACAHIVYQTHPMWTPGMEYLKFYAPCERLRSPYALEMKTGDIHKLVDADVTTSILAPKHGHLYYLCDRDLYVINVDLVFRGLAAPQKVATLPRKVVRVEGGLSLDSKENVIYAGVVLEEDKKWGIIALGIPPGKWRTITEQDFRIGHVQANPFVSGMIMFCHETGGNSPQRIWGVNATGRGLHPFYKETDDEWVTHEVWWGGTRALFTIWPYDEEHTKKPHGVVSADWATGRPTFHAQFPAWHVHGSLDGKWIVADDMDRNIWLIRAEDGERRLLTQGHLGEGFETHPHPSFTPNSKAVVFNSSRDGKEHIYMAELPEWESLPLP